jgi:hypothetical protein
MSAEGFDNSTETLLGHGKMWHFAWRIDVCIMHGAMHCAHNVTMHAVPFAGLAGERRNGTKRNKKSWRYYTLGFGPPRVLTTF